jgi:probable F420-dependent oxidoreductase
MVTVSRTKAPPGASQTDVSFAPDTPAGGFSGKYRIARSRQQPPALWLSLSVVRPQEVELVRVGVQVQITEVDYREFRDAFVALDEAGADMALAGDHFFPARADLGGPDGRNFEVLSLLAAMAAETGRIELGTSVLCNGFRNPNLTADMARTIDHVSGGRFMLGIGSGWIERDFVEYGYEFGTTGSRLRDLARDLPVIRARFERLNPPPLRRIPIMIGGAGEKTTLRLVAEHADIWHGYGDLPRLQGVLDDWCARVGRDPAEIERCASLNAAPSRIYEPDWLLANGFTFLLHHWSPPFDRAEVDEILAWRDRENARTPA